MGILGEWFYHIQFSSGIQYNVDVCQVVCMVVVPHFLTDGGNGVWLKQPCPWFIKI